MLSLLIAIILFIIGYLFCADYLVLAWGWSTFFASLVLLLALFIFNRIFGKKLSRLVENIQEILQDSQEKALQMNNRFQSRPLGSAKLMQGKLEEIVEKGVLKALDLLEQSRPLHKWTILASNQVNTLKMQLYYQIKRFDEVDALLAKKSPFARVIFFEPVSLAMKMARQYKHNDPKLEKSYRKGIRRFKSDKGTLIYAVYSWILIKRKKNDKALDVLTRAKAKTESEVLKRNWQQVANNKPHLFSNAALGEQWYALHLEPIPQRRPRSKTIQKQNPLAIKGKKRFR